jgi:hypothetical protein
MTANPFASAASLPSRLSIANGLAGDFSNLPSSGERARELASFLLQGQNPFLSSGQGFGPNLYGLTTLQLKALERVFSSPNVLGLSREGIQKLLQ